VAVALAGVACAFFLGAWAYWLFGCQRKLSQLDSGFEVDAGYYLSVLCFLLTLVVALLQGCIREKTGSSSINSQPDSSEEVGDRPPAPAEPARVGFVPTQLGKNLHLLSLVMLFCCLVSAVASVSSTRLPWSKFDQRNEVVRAALLSVQDCVSGDVLYYTDTTCRIGGEVVLTLCILGGLLCLFSAISVFQRDRAGDEFWKPLSIAGAALSSFFLLAAWVDWLSGCYASVVSSSGSADVNHSMGFGIIVVCWIASVGATVGQLLSRSGSGAGGGAVAGSSAPSSAPEGYSWLRDAEVPFL